MSYYKKFRIVIGTPLCGGYIYGGRIKHASATFEKLNFVYQIFPNKNLPVCFVVWERSYCGRGLLDLY